MVKIFSFAFLFFWFFRQFRSLLFWVYLWQLKEYHIGRFVDYFRTEKGKRVFKNPIFVFKVTLFLASIFDFESIFFALFFIYFLEFLKFLFDFFSQKLLLPVFTKKVLFLIFSGSLFLVFYTFIFFPSFFSLLLFDLLSGGIFSGIVLIFQPFSRAFRCVKIKEATKKRKEFLDLKVIGICGSFGKTSTKEFLATLLEEKFPKEVLKTKEHQNSEIAIAQTILNDLLPSHRFFVCEMGAYNKGGIKILAKMAKPQIAILTGANEQHLALFGSMENLISAEGGKELLESLPKEGLAIFNGENEILRKLSEEYSGRKKITTIEKEGDLVAKEIKVEKEKISFFVETKEKEKEFFEVKVVGRQNIENLLLAVAAAKELGMSLKECALAAKKIIPSQGGVLLKRTSSGVDVLDCTWSSNPTGILSHLEHLKLWDKKKVVVMPCLIELGEKSKEVHKKIGRKIAKVCDLAIVLTKDFFSQIKEGFLEEGGKSDKILLKEEPKEAALILKNFCQQGDVVLFEGRQAKKVLKIFGF
mgnify:CR=1 FL=1